MDWISNVINGALVMALFFLIFRRQDKRMDTQDNRIEDVVKKIDGQPSREYCVLQHKTTDERFEKSEEKFAKFETKIDSLHEAIDGVGRNVALLLDRDERE